MPLLLALFLLSSARQDGKATYAPPHEVDFHRIILGLKSLHAKGVVAIGSTGTLRPEAVPVGSIVMPDDYAFTLPAPVTFWGKLPMGAFDPADGQYGRIHFTPASADDADWVALRSFVHEALNPKLADAKGKISMAAGQTDANWPCVGDTTIDTKGVRACYVQTTGPRFETRSEIAQYAKLGHIVGMTCSSEWTLSQELVLPYALVCAVDNSANGLSSYPGGPLKEYLDHKGVIADVTGMLVKQLSEKLSAKAAAL